MKLRISGNSLRLRLTRTELTELVKVERLENRIQLGSGANQVLIYRLQLCAVRKSPAVGFETGQIVVFLPGDQARHWAESDEVGIYCDEAWGLKLIVEKDFKCLEPRPGENDSDAFDRPGGHARPACGLKPE